MNKQDVSWLGCLSLFSRDRRLIQWSPTCWLPKSTWLVLGVQHMQHFCRTAVPTVACKLVEKVCVSTSWKRIASRTCSNTWIYPVQTLKSSTCPCFSRSLGSLGSTLATLSLVLAPEEPRLAEFSHFAVAEAALCSSKVRVQFAKRWMKFQKWPVEVGSFEFHASTWIIGVFSKQSCVLLWVIAIERHGTVGWRGWGPNKVTGHSERTKWWSRRLSRDWSDITENHQCKAWFQSHSVS